MRHHLFAASNDTYRVALLIKGAAFNKQALEQHYVRPLATAGILAQDQVAFTLDYNNTGKAPVAFIKEYLAQLLPELASLGVTHLYVADANYFKVLAGQSKAEPHYGYVLPCKVKGYENLQIVLGVNHQALIYNPDLKAKLDLSLHALVSHVQGNYRALGADIIHSAQYPEGHQAIAEALKQLHRYPRLSCDIEAFSLRFNEAGIGTIAFAWDQHNGIAFACDYCPEPDPAAANQHGYQRPNPAVHALLLEFFCNYPGELVFHNSGYDVKVLIATLFMQDLADQAGLLRGLEVLTPRLHDTKIITYLATNSTAGNVLGLKPNAHEFAGNWAKEDIKDIRKIPLDELLQYNLVDCLSTQYVFNKYYPVMAADQQEALYRELMLPSNTMLIQTELTGMPLSKQRVQEVKAKLEGIRQDSLQRIHGNPVVAQLNVLLRHSAWEKDWEDRKRKAKNPDKILPKQLSAFDGLQFNPNSDPQMRRLLHEVMGLPVIDTTDTGLAATSADTLKKLVNHTSDPQHKDLLDAIQILAGVSTILDTFIPAFEGAVDRGDGDIVWLHGNFNLGGTVSGRLSSSDPNLTNIPAKVKVKAGGIEIDLGKLVKYCFVSPPGWIFAGADFNSLEDYISALTTKDPNKLKVYIDGFDGHSLRAVAYYPEQFAHIDINDPKQVNVLKKDDHPLRQESKVPTFALTYQGTYHTLMANLGWPEDKARRIEAAYHELYKVSDQWVQDRLQQASKDGYVTVAFGLRLRTPLLKQVMFGSRHMPYEAAAEGRTAGNALGQSYCMLTMRAMVDFLKKVWASPYRYDILPTSLIHDADYLLIRDDLNVIEFANRELIKSMQWQELPEIQHPTVKLGAALDLFWPDWAHPITLPNNADQTTIRQTVADALAAREAKAKKAA